MIMLDEEGLIEFWNESAEKIFGYTRIEALGHNLHTMLVPPSFLEAHIRAFPHFQKLWSCVFTRFKVVIRCLNEKSGY